MHESSTPLLQKPNRLCPLDLTSCGFMVNYRKEVTRMYRIKPWEELTIQDDYMFKRIMNIKRICLKLLQGILHVEIKDIHYLETEKSMEARYRGKGIRLDVYVRDDADTVYNIEMQVRMLDGDSLFKRTRYYQSMIDADLLAAGADYDELNKTIIIFICPFDPFGEGRHIYTFRNFCAEDKDLELQDGTAKIFLNSKGTMDDVDEEVKAFLDYMNGILSDNPLVQAIDEAIQSVKLEKEERVSYMTFAMKMMEERKEGFREGKAEGLLLAIRNVMKNMSISLEKAMDVLQIPAEERAKYAALVKE